MTIREFINKCKELVPNSDTYQVGESYGDFGVINDNAPLNKVLFCVTPTPEVEQYFMQNHYDLLISHHPFHVHPHIPHLILHTALDCCKGGINDMWHAALNIQNAKHFDKNLGWYGEITPMSFAELVQKIEIFIEGKIQGQCYSDKKIIRTVCVCSGLGGLVFKEAEATSADCYILGQGMHQGKGKFPAIIEIGHTLSEYQIVSFFRNHFPTIQIDSAPLEIDYFYGGEIA